MTTLCSFSATATATATTYATDMLQLIPIRILWVELYPDFLEHNYTLLPKGIDQPFQNKKDLSLSLSLSLCFGLGRVVVVVWLGGSFLANGFPSSMIHINIILLLFCHSLCTLHTHHRNIFSCDLPGGAGSFSKKKAAPYICCCEKVYQVRLCCWYSINRMCAVLVISSYSHRHFGKKTGPLLPFFGSHYQSLVPLKSLSKILKEVLQITLDYYTNPILSYLVGTWICCYSFCLKKTIFIDLFVPPSPPIFWALRLKINDIVIV